MLTADELTALLGSGRLVPVPLPCSGSMSVAYVVGSDVFIKVCTADVPDGALAVEAAVHALAYKYAPDVVVPPIGLVTLAGGVQGLAMRRLYGFPSATKNLCTLKDVMEHPGSVPAFDTVFRSLVFQVLKGLADLAATGDKGTEGRFRHNDLHVANVGVEVNTALSEVQPVTVRVYRRVRSATECVLVTNTVHKYKVPVMARARLLDFGHAAFVKAQADVRYADRKSPYARGGASGTAPSRHYDMFLFMSSVFLTIRDARSDAVPIAYGDFRKMYMDTLGHVLTSHHVEPGTGGRLKPEAQASLLVNLNLEYVHPATGETVMTCMPYPERLLQHEFFQAFREDGEDCGGGGGGGGAGSEAAPCVAAMEPVFGPGARTMPVHEFLAVAAKSPPWVTPPAPVTEPWIDE
jgi:hypothetical protein